jgi:hypothetical protein
MGDEKSETTVKAGARGIFRENIAVLVEATSARRRFDIKALRAIALISHFK